MHIYFSGIGGAGMSALAHMAIDIGYKVSGSDIAADSRICQQLISRGVKINDDQSADFLATRHHRHPVDWMVYSAAIPDDNDERILAKQLGIKQTKRDELLHHYLDKYNLELWAIAGTHGKTTTTSMLAWVANELGPASWLIGSEIPFGNPGQLDPKSTRLILEADEYDRMMLKFEPNVTLITNIDYDHPDIYPTEDDYHQAFRQLVNQSGFSVGWLSDAQTINLSDSSGFHALEQPTLSFEQLPLIGRHNRANAELAACALELREIVEAEKALEILANFPGTSRRFEQLTDNLFSDYAHHPTAVRSTIELAREYCEKQVCNQLVVVYQPHQDERQRSVKDAYEHAFDQADTVYWLPTYEPPGRHHRPSLPPQELIKCLSNPDIATIAEQNKSLLSTIESHLEKGDLVLVMGAGSVDKFVREHFQAMPKD